MLTLIDVFKPDSTEVKEGLTELTVKEKSKELIKLFTAMLVEVLLHWEEEGPFRGFFRCLGDGCLYCRVREPSKYYLLPVLDIVNGRVVILRLSSDKGPYRLSTQITALICDPEVSKMIVTLKRIDKFRYQTESHKKDGCELIGANEIAAFEKQLQTGTLDIGSIYPSYSNDELKEIQRVKKALEVLEFTKTDG